MTHVTRKPVFGVCGNQIQQIVNLNPDYKERFTDIETNHVVEILKFLSPIVFEFNAPMDESAFIWKEISTVFI